MHRSLVALALAFAVVLPLQAMPADTVLFQQLGKPGQTVDEVMLDVAPRLRAYADQTGFESCGEIGQDEQGRYGVVITTSQSKTVCAIDENLLPVGMVSTGQSIHSHGRDEPGTLSRREMMLRGEATDARSMRSAKITGQRIDRFSPADLDAEPGYLAIPNGLIHHDGRRRVRVVR